MQINVFFTATLAAGLLAAAPVFAEPSVTVRSLNRGPEPGATFAYDPAIIRIPVGGAVQFEPTDRGHNVVPVPGLWPEGAPALNVPYNQAAEVSFPAPGVYAVQCTPHAGLGMVALIVVGDTDVATFAARIPSAQGLAPRARARLNELVRAAS